ncbi:MAG: hypothetical protein ACQES1_02390 [Bacteroidota bacterium]
MNTTELRANLHNFIDQIEDINLLKDYYQEMKKLINSSKSSMWDTLSDEQKREVLMSFEESENDDNLIDNEDVMKMYRKWL